MNELLMSEMIGSGVKLIINSECERPNVSDNVALVAQSGADLPNMLDSLSGSCDK